MYLLLTAVTVIAVKSSLCLILIARLTPSAFSKVLTNIKIESESKRLRVTEIRLY